MGTTLNHYPTTAQVRALLSDEEVDNLVSEVADYHRSITLAEYHGNVTPDLFHAWATFVQEIMDEYPDATMSRDFKVTRQATRVELEEHALASQQSSRYYHPENYPLDYAYDDETDKYINASDVKEHDYVTPNMAAKRDHAIDNYNKENKS